MVSNYSIPEPSLCGVIYEDPGSGDADRLSGRKGQESQAFRFYTHLHTSCHITSANAGPRDRTLKFRSQRSSLKIHVFGFVSPTFLAGWVTFGGLLQKISMSNLSEDLITKSTQNMKLGIFKHISLCIRLSHCCKIVRTQCLFGN